MQGNYNLKKSSRNEDGPPEHNYESVMLSMSSILIHAIWQMILSTIYVNKITGISEEKAFFSVVRTICSLQYYLSRLQICHLVRNHQENKVISLQYQWHTSCKLEQALKKYIVSWPWIYIFLLISEKFSFFFLEKAFQLFKKLCHLSKPRIFCVLLTEICNK